MKSHWMDTFQSPSSAYRGKPFWAWNGTLDPHELRRQVRVMHRMGLGGFFMHSRVGLNTPYLSEDWFRCVDACIDEAKQLDMEAWLYDEDRWPSGAAGGLVTRDERYRMRSLACSITTRPADLKWTKDVLAAFTARIDGAEATDVKRLARGKRPRLARGQSLLIFRVVLAPLSDWYNGYTYLDVLNPRAVAEFIEVTHEAYRKHCGKHFGGTVPGIFTDEPNHGGKFLAMQDSNIDGTVPWTGDLPKVFRKRYGYDLIARLPEVFFDVEGRSVTPARHDYHDCLTHLFVESFAKQIGDWCDRNHLLHTGHVLCEQPMTGQAMVVGSAMRFYEYMQAPGMDLLTEVRREFETAKMVSSAARQFGRTWRLTETYGCTGWDFPFASHKALGDWQAAMGINLRCQHLSWYTMAGQAKRDYPASIFFQSPWWEHYRKVEDYFARLHVALTRGAEVRDLLVLLPIESVWMTCNIGWQPGSTQRGSLDDRLVELRDTLLRQNIDFDYGDEDILARHGKVSRGKAPRLRVGRADYRAVIVPPSVTIRRSTLKLLRRFADAGGRVVFAGQIAEYVDAEPGSDAIGLARATRKAPHKGIGLIDAVDDVARRLSISDADGEELPSTLYQLREDREAMILFVCNLGQTVGPKQGDPHCDLPVRKRTLDCPVVNIRGFAGCEGQPIELDPETGEEFAVDAGKTREGWVIRTNLPPLGSRLFVIPKKPDRKKRSAHPVRKTISTRTVTPKRWDVSLSESNCLVLDRPAAKIGSGRFGKPEEVLRVDDAVRDALGVKRRGGQMKQPWTREPGPHHSSTPLALRYTFEVQDLPSGDLSLGLEEPRRYRVTLNGRTISTDAECGWWVDPSLRRLPLDPGMLREGTNELHLACDYDEEHPGLEIVYLLGHFGVKVSDCEASLTAPPTSLPIGDWTKQGLAFYGGSVTYRTTLSPKLTKKQRAVLQIPDFGGAALAVRVNGADAGVVAWPPWELDITDLLSGRRDHIEIEVLGTRRNSHGPLHLKANHPAVVGPGTFRTTGEEWQDEYNLAPAGLLKPPRLIVRQ
jgi:hypothetical protein